MPAANKKAKMAEDPSNNLDGLWKLWADDEVVRSQILQKGTLFSWPDPKCTGVINFETMEHNTRVLEYLAETWCPKTSAPKTIYIPHAREQAKLLLKTSQVPMLEFV